MTAVRALTRKAVRDIARQRGQAIAVGVTIALGVALYVSSAGAFRNLSSSYEFTYDDLGLADLVATGGEPAGVADAAWSAGAAAVDVRTVADVPLTIDGTRLLGRLAGLAEGGTLDRVRVVEGTDLPTGAAAADHVLLERHAADAFGATPGDRVQVWTPAGWHEVTVDGVVVSAEYLWPARSRQEVFGDPHSFAVVFARESAVAAWVADAPQQVLVALPDDAAGVATAVTEAMRQAGAADVVPRSEQPSHATLQEDLDAFAEISIAFPLLFLTAAAVAAYVAFTRRVRAERPTIGTFMAAGARRSLLVRHYVQQGVLVGTAGSAVGAGLGVLLTAVVTRAYTDGLGIPDTVVLLYPTLIVMGLALGPLVGAVGALAPAVAAARTDPAEAMRQQGETAAPGRWGRAVSHLRAVPVTVRLALRDVARGPRRTVATALGATLALVLIVSAVGMMTSMTAALDVQFGQVQREDATVVADPSAGDLGATLEALPGVVSVEPSTTARVTAAHGASTYVTTLAGFEPATRMHGFRAVDGAWVDLPGSGVLAGRALADTLGVAVGDSIDLHVDDGTGGSVELVGLLDEPLGTSLYGTRSTVTALVGEPAVATWLVRLEQGADRDAMRQRITNLDGVVAYTDAKAAVAVLDDYLGLFWVFVAAMVALGAALALAVIHVTMAVNIAERTGEIATFRAAGVPVRTIARTLATSNLVATAVGIPFGLAAGFVAGSWFMASFSSDLFAIPFALPWWVSFLAACAVLAGAGASQWTAVRAVLRVDVARVVRERAL